MITEEELAEMERAFLPPRRVGTGLGFYGAMTIDREAYERSLASIPRLIAALRASREELAALSWATKEYDEDSGYCLCGCCRHGI